MNNSSSHMNTEASIAELIADFINLRDALNELTLTLADLQFRIDMQERSKIAHFTHTFLDGL
jgi:hypothetical protein